MILYEVLFTAIFVLLQAGVGNAQYAVFSPDSSISDTVTTDKAVPLEAQYKGTQILGNLPRPQKLGLDQTKILRVQIDEYRRCSKKEKVDFCYPKKRVASLPKD